MSTSPPPELRRHRRWLGGRLWLGAAVLLALAPLLWAAGGVAYPGLEVFAEALAALEQGYVVPVDPVVLLRGALRGLAGSLDPHTVYLQPEVYRELQQNVSGEFGGLGLELEMRRGEILVVTPLDGGPALRAGIRSGDRVVSVDGVPVAELSLFDVLIRLRGRPGEPVELELSRRGVEQMWTVRVERETIRVTSVQGELLRDHVLYLRLRSFQQSTFRSLAETLERLELQAGGAAQVRGCVLDLRNNPGGLLEQAVQVADEFLDEGLIVSTEGRRPEDAKQHRARPGGRVGYPLVVLVNGGSASASEIVAGALQDHHRALLVGTRTFGKGSVQTLLELSDGSALKMTVAHYFTPLHRCIQDQGIEPDRSVVEPPSPAAPGPGAEGLPPWAQRDAQLLAALAALPEAPRGQRPLSEPALSTPAR